MISTGSPTGDSEGLQGGITPILIGSLLDFRGGDKDFCLSYTSTETEAVLHLTRRVEIFILPKHTLAWNTKY